MSQAVVTLALAGLLSLGGGQSSTTAVDASAVRVGAPTTVTELDLGKLKGELRQIGWSPDGSELYIQTADGDAQNPKLRHYLVAATGGVPRMVDVEPDWATTFWEFKSDRMAPGMGSLMIDFEQKIENVKIGTGSGRPGGAGGTSSLGDSGADPEKSAEGQRQNFARLTLLGEVISEFVNERPIPGLMFSWGPNYSGAIAYTDRESGHLMLLDRNKHKQTVPGIKDALLPAWSTDGTRLAWVRKTGRKKYALVWAAVSMKG